jgi:hypothetical protein
VTAAINRITEARRALERAKRDLEMAEEASFRRLGEVRERIKKDETLKKWLKQIVDFDVLNDRPEPFNGMARGSTEGALRQARVHFALDGIAAAIAFGLVLEPEAAPPAKPVLVPINGLEAHLMNLPPRCEAKLGLRQCEQELYHQSAHCAGLGLEQVTW